MNLLEHYVWRERINPGPLMCLMLRRLITIALWRGCRQPAPRALGRKATRLGGNRVSRRFASLSSLWLSLSGILAFCYDLAPFLKAAIAFMGEALSFLRILSNEIILGSPPTEGSRRFRTARWR